MSNQYFKNASLLVISLAAVISIFLLGPIKQDPGYHQFSDQNTYFLIPNFWNVISNLPFLIIGLIGIPQVLGKIHNSPDYQIDRVLLVFFVGIFLTGIGSGFYHYNPSDKTLFWDRLPMTISFMSFFCIVICEFVSIKTGLKLFIPLFLSGIASLIYWKLTDVKGVGDLRFYVLIQFLPILLITFILFFYSKRSKSCFVQIIILYLLAKLFEMNDHFIFLSTRNLISGHSVKHFFAAAGPFLFLISLRKGKILSILQGQ